MISTINLCISEFLMCHQSTWKSPSVPGRYPQEINRRCPKTSDSCRHVELEGGGSGEQHGALMGGHAPLWPGSWDHGQNCPRHDSAELLNIWPRSSPTECLSLEFLVGLLHHLFLRMESTARCSTAAAPERSQTSLPQIPKMAVAATVLHHPRR